MNSEGADQPADIDPGMRARVAELLGREPRGLQDVPVRRDDGSPVVIRVASLVDDRPFPTLFWLVDPGLNYRIDREEASGTIKQLQERIDADPQLQAQMREDHRRHIALRDSYLQPAQRRRLRELGFAGVFADRGIGGIANFHRIRCLHTWYAAHLVEPNTVGRLLDTHWQAESRPGNPR